VLDLPRSGSKEEQIDCILAFLLEPQDSGKVCFGKVLMVLCGIPVRVTFISTYSQSRNQNVKSPKGLVTVTPGVISRV